MKNLDQCVICSSASVFERCARCRDPFCMEHAAIGDTRCVACEVQFAGQVDRVRFRRWFLVPFAAIWLVYWMLVDVIRTTYPRSSGGYRAITTGSPIVDAFCIALLASIVSGITAVRVRRYLLRRRFLRGR